MICKRLLLLALLANLPMPAISANSTLVAPAASPKQGKPWLGISIEKGPSGVTVKGILPGTPAEGAGLKAGDEILKVNDQAVIDPPALISKIQSFGIGDTVKLDIKRGAEHIVKNLKLVMRPDELQLIRDKLVGKPAPSFKLSAIHGKEPGNSQKLKGRVSVIEFWATWCPACRASHARLSQFAKEHPKIAVLAISDEDPAAIKEYVSKINPAFSVFTDQTHSMQETWMASAIPMLAVLDKKGIVVFVTVGAGENLEEALQKAESLQ